MTPCHLIVAGFGRPEMAGEFASCLAQVWPTESRVEIELCDAAQVSLSSLQRAAAIILLVRESEKPTSVRRLIGLLEESQVAALVLTDADDGACRDYRHAGVPVMRIDRDMYQIAACLEGMLARQREVRHLQREMALAQRFHGGLRGEIARMHDELQLAAMVQREFLPRDLPSLMGVEFAVMWRPANYVSGDIYDVLRLDDDHIGFFLADAVGHGVPAALMTMVISRSLVMKQISGHRYRLLEPCEVLANLNVDMIRRQGRSTRFATAAYGLLNCRSRVLRVAGAGHPAPILHGADGSSRELATPGGLLGVFPEEKFEQVEVSLSVGDNLLLYSDGFEQAFPSQTNDSYERRLPTSRYRDEFGRLARDSSPESFIDALGRALDDQQGSLHQVDDLTMICLHAGPITTDSDEFSESGDTARRSSNPEVHSVNEPSLAIGSRD